MKHINLNNVIPAPMAGIDFTDSVWNSSFEFSKGKSYLVKAPSGTGKSSFVAFLYGLRKDYNGEISFDGDSLKSMSLGAWAKVRQRELSIVHQELRLFPNLSAGDNLMLKQKLTQAVDKQLLKELASRLGIGGKLDQKCGTLSLGQQQRIAIIRSLLQPFDFLLLDEPFSHLDSNNISIARELIAEYCEKNEAGMILTSLGDPYNFKYDSELTL